MITCLGLAPSFGFGDRTGLATPGHVAAALEAANGIEPIFPQQSIREMSRTRRTPEQVMNDALGGMRQAGWTGRSGADADHLEDAAGRRCDCGRRIHVLHDRPVGARRSAGR